MREVLEESHPEDFVSCTLLHPLDTHLVVECPSEQAMRVALLKVRDKITAAKNSIAEGKTRR